VKKCDDKCTDTHEARHREVNHNDMVVVTLTFLAWNKKIPQRWRNSWDLVLIKNELVD